MEDGQSPVENLGQVVFGERIRPSPYKVRAIKFKIFLYFNLDSEEKKKYKF